MKDILQTLLLLVIAITAALFFGPIIAIFSIIGNVNLGVFRLNLEKHSNMQRIVLGVLGLGVWVSIYVPLIIFISRSLPSPSVAPSLPENITAQSRLNQLPLHSQLTLTAWIALIDEKYDLTIALADECIKNFESQALQIQNIISIRQGQRDGVE